MNRDCTITTALKRRQQTVFREAEQRGLTHKVIHYDTGGPDIGISLSALGQYARGECAMGLPVLIKLLEVLPADLLSLLLPAGWQIVRADEGIDHDAVAEWAEAHLAKKMAAHRADSECAEKIGPKEHAELCASVVAFPAKVAA